jgi:HPt (histidine-containing phosphotransfer) domain-containing protein
MESSAGGADPGSGQRVEPPLDLDHLSRMTLGDRTLEREVLQLFAQQAGMLAERLRGASAAVVASCAHTLKGSARGIGAWPLARAAEQVEHVARAGDADLTAGIARLIGAVSATREAIAQRLRE